MSRKYKKEIYQAYNPIEQKFYVGQSTFGLATAKARHKSKSLIQNKKSPFYDAIRKYGFGTFEWSVVCICQSEEELDTMERETISSRGIDNCYNCQTGGRHKYKLPEDVKENISRRMEGPKNPQWGKTRTTEEMKKCKERSLEVCSKKVIKIETGEIYPSVSDCARQNNCSIANVSLNCNGKAAIQKYRFL